MDKSLLHWFSDIVPTWVPERGPSSPGPISQSGPQILLSGQLWKPLGKEGLWRPKPIFLSFWVGSVCFLQSKNTYGQPSGKLSHEIIYSRPGNRELFGSLFWGNNTVSRTVRLGCGNLAGSEYISTSPWGRGMFRGQGGWHSGGLNDQGGKGSAPVLCCLVLRYLGTGTGTRTTVRTQHRLPLSPQASSQGVPKGLSQAFPVLSIRIKFSRRAGRWLASHSILTPITLPFSDTSAYPLPQTNPISSLRCGPCQSSFQDWQGICQVLRGQWGFSFQRLRGPGEKKSI